MIHLKIPSTSGPYQEIIDRLKELTLAYRSEIQADLEDATLADGLQTIEGVEAIKAYLDETEGELKHWYYCSC